MFKGLKRIIIVTGHYGCGKTNLAVNLALYFETLGERVTVVDMDIVNPYFRSADFEREFEGKRIKLIAPNFANTLLDIPSLPREVDGAIEGDERLILDVGGDDAGYEPRTVGLGGDDAGAVVLGRYAKQIEQNGGASMIYLFSKYRPFTETADDVISHIGDIEVASRIKVTGLINSSNLGLETTAKDIEASFGYADEISEKTGLPVLATLVRDTINESVNNSFPVRLFVLPPWEAV